MEDKNCNCGHNHAHGEDCTCGEGAYPTITLTLEDDSEIECDILGTFDVDNIEYIAVVPTDSDEALIYRYTENGEEVEIESIESDEEFNKVSEVFYSLFEDEFEDYDEDEDEDENEE